MFHSQCNLIYIISVAKVLPGTATGGGFKNVSYQSPKSYRGGTWYGGLEKSLGMGGVT